MEAVNIIPDRNWNIADKETQAKKVEKLNSYIEAAKKRYLPILVGTEMNAYGLPFVDNFTADAMKPHYTVFKEGADILYAHTQMERYAQRGFMSCWALEYFTDAQDKYAFYATVGAQLEPGNPYQIEILQEAQHPEALLDKF